MQKREAYMRVIEAMISGAKMATPFLAVAGVALAGVGAFNSIQHLLVTYIRIDDTAAAITALNVVGLTIGLMIYLIAFPQGNNAVRGAASLFLVIWLVMVMILVMFDSAMRGGIMQVPDAVVSLGQVFAPALTGLTLIPVLTILIVSRNIKDTKYLSAWGAAGDYIGWFLKGASLLAGIASEFYFGLSMKLPSIFVFFASMLMGGLSLFALSRVSDAKERRDRYDIRAWNRVLAVTFGYLILVVGEATQELAGQRYMPDWLHNFAKLSYFYSVALFLGLYIYVFWRTTRIDDIEIDDKPHTPAEVTVGLPGWAIRSRAAWAALNGHPGDNQRALPAPSEAYPKTSDTGEGYDITGTFIMSQETPEIADTSPDKDITKPLGKIAEQARREVNSSPKA